MEDTLCQRFFLQPDEPSRRRYESLRAVFVERRRQDEVAEQFGYTYNTMRRFVSDFRRQCRDGQTPPFWFLRTAESPPAMEATQNGTTRTSQR